MQDAQSRAQQANGESLTSHWYQNKSAAPRTSATPKRPLGQSVHVELPSVAYFPGLHKLSTGAEVVDSGRHAYPALQLEQTVAPAVLYLPPGHPPSQAAVCEPGFSPT
jgi:hypothetical protein